MSETTGRHARPHGDEPIREDEREDLTPLEALIRQYVREYMPQLQRQYRRFEQLAGSEDRPEGCKHVYAGTSYGDGIICTPCATEASIGEDAMRMAKAQINQDRRDLSVWMLKIARQDKVLLFTPAELKMLGWLANELENPRCV